MRNSYLVESCDANLGGSSSRQSKKYFACRFRFTLTLSIICVGASTTVWPGTVNNLIHSINLYIKITTKIQFSNMFDSENESRTQRTQLNYVNE